MLSQFEAGKAEGLRGVLMMQLCKEFLGVRNNMIGESLTPQEWYDALDIRAEIRLPDYEYVYRLPSCSFFELMCRFIT